MMKPECKKFVAAMDKSTQALLTEDPRGHLGASQIGGDCKRKGWYGFRWYHNVKHGGRLLRLFNRGHDEEFRVVNWLRSMGAEVRDYQQRLMWNTDTNQYLGVAWDDPGGDPIIEMYQDVSKSEQHIKLATAMGQGPRQWNFKDHGGHFSGSSDGKVSGLEEWFPTATGWGLFENKTINAKGFKALNNVGLQKHSNVYWVQLHTYMRRFNLKWCLHVTVCKDNDDIYVEFIELAENVADYYSDVAYKMIVAEKPPPRISRDASFFKCKWCDHRRICHYKEDPDKNCRSCAYAEPLMDGNDASWRCRRWDAILPKDFMAKGCSDWFMIEGD